MQQIIDYKDIENEDTLLQTIQNVNNANLSARAEIMKVAFANQAQKKHADDEEGPLDVDSHAAFNRKESCLKKWGVPM